MGLEGDAGRPNGRRVKQKREPAAPKAMRLETLDIWLRQLEPSSKVDGVSMLDGYLTAIAIGPCSIQPDEWFVDLLGSSGIVGSAYGQHLAAMMAIADRFNTIGETLSQAPDRNAPIFKKKDDGTVLAAPWCMGFLSAMHLRLNTWQTLCDLERIEHALLLPILLHCIDEHGSPMLGPARAESKTKDFLRDAYHDIPLVIPQIQNYWMPKRLKDR